MSGFFKIDVKDQDLLGALQAFFRRLLESGRIDALMVPWHLPIPGESDTDESSPGLSAPGLSALVMPTLITDPDDLKDADPLAPSFPINAAKMASRLTKRRSGKTVGLVMRPCEIRAFAELTKLKQGAADDILLISLDCLGAYTNSTYSKQSARDPKGFSKQFYEAVLDGTPLDADGEGLAGACTICEHPVSALADINIALYGMDFRTWVAAQAQTPKGEAAAERLKLESLSEPPGRGKQVAALISERISARDKVFQATSEATSTIEKLSAYLARCVNCYNCRVACPVCYCKECVFVTDVFDHDPYQYMRWAEAKGRVKLPTDTDFFHLTRMAHIGLTCVGCGQCANACPNDIPLAELFRTVAHKAQEAFDYEAGRRMDEPIPFSVFNDKEYDEVVGTATGSQARRRP